MTAYNWFSLPNGRSVYRKAEQATDKARSDLPCPMTIRDDMAPTEHVDGRFYTSKSEYRAITKREGLVELGNDCRNQKAPPRPKVDRSVRIDAAKRAEYMVRNKLKP